MGVCHFFEEAHLYQTRSRLTLLAFAIGMQLSAADYLPLATGMKWTLRPASGGQPVTFEVMEKEGNAFRVRFSSPWATNDWKLKKLGDKVSLVGYGAGGPIMPLPDTTTFFDFESKEGSKWKNAAGNISVASRSMRVNAKAGTFDNCITMKQSAGSSNFLYTFAPDVGFVQFGEGKSAFTLEELPNANAAPAPVPTAPVPTASRRTRDRAPQNDRSRGRVLLGTTVTTFPNESDSPNALMSRFDQTVTAGVSYISGAGKWTELEPSKGKYNFDPINFQAHLAEKNGAKMSYTLRLIDTIHKAVPKDLMGTQWDDPKMKQRVLALIDGMAPLFRGRVQWFMFGNEVDGYFEKHPDEVEAFAKLHDEVTARVKSLAPEVAVSTTVQYGGIDKLNGMLKPLNDRMEFLSITYYPMQPDFTVQPPDAPRRDLPRMKSFAGTRQIVLQEIGYPTGSANKSNQEMQAQFFSNVFSEMKANSATFAAGSVFLLADLRDKFAKDLSSYYGINGYEPFRSFLQTLGMFDGSGQPKQSWAVFQRELK